MRSSICAGVAIGKKKRERSQSTQIRKDEGAGIRTEITAER